MENRKIRVIHYGLGPIGLATAKMILKKQDMEIVGAVDIAKDVVGKDLGEIMGVQPLGIHVTDDAERLFATTTADVVIHTAGSRLKQVIEQIETILRGGKNIVSSSEELLFPTPENTEAAAKIDKLAREKGVTVLGTGVNPGFVMDALPLTMTGVCEKVREVHVERVVDAGTRRYPLQRKVGAGMTPELFRQKVAEKAMGHVGLRESLYLIADRLHLVLDDIRETVEPMIAEKPLKTDYFELKPGDVAGIKNLGEGFREGKKIITLDLRMYIGAEDPHDSIRIIGNPGLNLRIEGGVAGDQATAAILMNSISAVVAAAPGLVTVKDLPAPYCHQ
jgi:2,4-diaminopentanoate dehydrogenase